MTLNRDLPLALIPCVMRYVCSLTNVLSDHLGWHCARLTFMTRFTTALLTQTNMN